MIEVGPKTFDWNWRLISSSLCFAMLASPIVSSTLRISRCLLKGSGVHVCGVVHEDIDAAVNREGCLNLISDGSIILVLVYLGGLGPSLCKFRQAGGIARAGDD